ncbi:MAG TPA: serine/threonine-protein kinase [Vicinamibacterales bacterium]|nr:serine/threonine-protein kinase [Vicinamibacterales bacterium]
MDDARLEPGHIFAGRYRIVNRLGRGAMGEVYRADDLRLQQPVALKLLAAPAGHGNHAIERFVREVRLARGIAHPNVCRVYDIGDADGWHYLSMEYVDGETLASLLRRIGPLPREKALDIARQLCAGIAAAHDQRVLHRDLKPANIMVDGRGRIRIMDFGIAVPADDTSTRESAGTPGYMAPEQRAGGRVSERTDIYAIGLVLYELFVGHPFHAAPSLLAGDRRPQLTELDADIADVVARCLQSDLAKRPSSALAVEKALPAPREVPPPFSASDGTGTDAITHLTPTGTLRPAVAWIMLAATIGGTLAVTPRAHFFTVAPSDIPKPPEVLADRSTALLAGIGGEIPADSEFGFTTGAKGSDRSIQIRFAYRQSPQYLVPGNLFHLVTEDDPAANLPGMASVVIDPTGRLVRIASIRDIAPDRAQAPADWSRLFREAGLDQREFIPATSDRAILVPHDQRFYWQKKPGTSTTVGVTAASLGNSPVFFEVSDNPIWRPAPRNVLISRRPVVAEALLWSAIVLAIAVAATLARRNRRAGRVDRDGARKLAIFTAIGGVLFALLRGHHVPSGLDEIAYLLGVSGWALVWSAFASLVYVAMAPHAQRLWPTMLTSWTSLWAGRIRDPLVGRDVLAGLLAGIAWLVLLIGRCQVMGCAAPEILVAPALESIRSSRHVAAALAFDLTDALQFTLAGLLFLVVLRLIVRKPRVATALWVLLIAPLQFGATLGPSTAPLVWDLAFALALAALAATLFLQVGLLAAYVTLIFERLMTHVPMTLDPNVWYAGPSYLILAMVFALAIYGFVVALGGRSAFGVDAVDSAMPD